jgi:hypothetical protein
MPDVRSIGFSFDLGGLPQAMVVFQTILEQALPEVVMHVAKELRTGLEGKTPVSSKGGSKDKDSRKQDVYHMKDHWSNATVLTGSVIAAGFENPTRYGPMLEFGLYPPEWIHPGGKLVAVAGGVFSTQAPGGILTPLIQDETLDELARNSLQTLLDQLVGMAG